MTRKQQKAHNAENYPASVLTWLNEATDRAFDECEKENTITLEQLEEDIYAISKKPFRIDIATEYKSKSIYVDFGFDVHFENEGTHIDDIFKSVLTQIQGYFR